ncbi:DUF721 domain-containing protein [Methylobacter sp. YRD-M1]|uniref:DUF721 domain-containing protein n=1 Tax=Methylobacter sp. YRD-M1 TaxID=2911520 RepID=UPI00227C64B8|nr:DUF721 domain-containing protein [Methylobacter sp. YRD-M1]WAK02746.1 DUF721 domain-containing protein [Methylobacter sp. YRD-M1]
MAKKPAAFKAALSFPNRAIAHFYSRIEQQRQILQHIREALPEALAKHARYCVVNDKKLLIYTDSAAWASQLRFYSQAILAAVAPITREPVTLMQVKILTEQKSPYEKPIRRANVPAKDKIEIIRNLGLNVPDNQLKQALLKLSATLQRLSDDAE